MIGMRLTECPELIRRAGILQAAAGVHVGQPHRLFRCQDLRRFCHETHAAKGDHVGIGSLGLARELEAVPDIVGNVLDFGLLIIVREDDCVVFLLEALDLVADIDPRK